MLFTALLVTQFIGNFLGIQALDQTTVHQASTFAKLVLYAALKR